MSSTIPIGDIHSQEDFKIDDFFLLDTLVRGKDYIKDDKLDLAYWRMSLYPFYYNKRLYNYLMSDNYYYKSALYKIFPNIADCVLLEKIPPYFSERTNTEKYPIIEKEKRICETKDVKEIFEKFKKNNFKNNPIIEIILG